MWTSMLLPHWPTRAQASGKLPPSASQLAWFEPAVSGELLQLLQQTSDRLLVLSAQLSPDLGIGLPILLVLVVGGQPLELGGRGLDEVIYLVVDDRLFHMLSHRVLPGDTAQATCRARSLDGRQRPGTRAGARALIEDAAMCE